MSSRSLTSAAFSALLAEVKSRVVAQDEFSVWYRSDEERQLVEEQVTRLKVADATLARFADELVARSRIIGEQ